MKELNKIKTTKTTEEAKEDINIKTMKNVQKNKRNIIDDEQRQTKKTLEYKNDLEKEENKKENISKTKILEILKNVKNKGNITYGELASQLGEVEPEEIDKIFEAFEELGISVLKDDDDLLEPNLEDLENVEEIKLEDLEVEEILKFLQEGIMETILI